MVMPVILSLWRLQETEIRQGEHDLLPYPPSFGPSGQHATLARSGLPEGQAIHIQVSPHPAGFEST